MLAELCLERKTRDERALKERFLPGDETYFRVNKKRLRDDLGNLLGRTIGPNDLYEADSIGTATYDYPETSSSTARSVGGACCNAVVTPPDGRVRNSQATMTKSMTAAPPLTLDIDVNDDDEVVSAAMALDTPPDCGQQVPNSAPVGTPLKLAVTTFLSEKTRSP